MADSIIALLYGLAAFIMPEFLAAHSFLKYTGQPWDMLLKENAEIANYILILEGAAGGLGIATILANLFVLLTSFRKGEKWSWFFVLIVSMTAWGSNLITNILLKNSISVVIMLFGLLLLAIALAISAKAFLFEKVKV